MTDKSEVIAQIETMLSNMDTIRRQVELNAVLARTSYDTLISTGFTEEQAMELIKARGPMLA